jgi:Flp pilus assembly protein TadD
VPDSFRKPKPKYRYNTPRTGTPNSASRNSPDHRDKGLTPDRPSLAEPKPLDDQGGNPGDPDPPPGDDGDWGDDPGDGVYCNCCGYPWYNCMWMRCWSPMWWWYWGCDYGWWCNYWRPAWFTTYVSYHRYYDYESYYPSIYSAAAHMVDPSSDAITYLDEGAALFRNGQYLEALHQFRLATLADLTFAIAKFAYAQGLFALGIYEYAAYEIRLGLEIMAEWPEIGGDVKLLYGDVKDFEQQLQALKAHLEIQPDDEDARTVLGYVLFFSGDLAGAEEAFLKLHLSQDRGNTSVASLFLSSIAKIKERLDSAQDPAPSTVTYKN